jgi:hypothetical protein
MLGNGLLATTLNDGEYYGTYRAIVIDVGAFTTDFASLTFRSRARKAIITDVHFDQVTHSNGTYFFASRGRVRG